MRTMRALLAVLSLLLLAGCAAVSEDTAWRMGRGVRPYSFRVAGLVRDGVIRLDDLHPAFRERFPRVPDLSVYVSARCGSLAPHGHPWIMVSATRWDENGEPFGFSWDDADVRHELGHALGGERHWGDGGPDR